MKMKYIALALCAGQLSLAHAQETPTKEAPAKKATETATPTFKAETPLEKHALKVMTIVNTFPDILGSIKDDTSADAAKTKLDELVMKLNAEGELIKKNPVPDNATRKALFEKMLPLQKAMEQRMQGSMIQMMSLPPELAPKVQEIMMGFGPKMQTFGETMQAYFEPDKEAPAPPAPAKTEEKK